MLLAVKEFDITVRQLEDFIRDCGHKSPFPEGVRWLEEKIAYLRGLVPQIEVEEGSTVEIPDADYGEVQSLLAKVENIRKAYAC